MSLISGNKKLYAHVDYVTIFCRTFFVLQYRKTLQGNRSVVCFRKFPVAKKFMDKREGEVSRFTFENFLCLTVPKKFVVTRTRNLLLGNLVVLSLPLSFIFE